jgi:hypothetical protein
MWVLLFFIQLCACIRARVQRNAASFYMNFSALVHKFQARAHVCYTTESGQSITRRRLCNIQVERSGGGELDTDCVH